MSHGLVDTAADAQAALDRIWRAMPLERKAEITVRMMNDARDLARSGIRLRHPGYSATDVEHALHRLWVGEELADLVWPQHRHLVP